MSNRFIDKLRRFADLTDSDIGALQRVTAGARSVPARSDLIREGDRPGPMFVILDGWAMRYKILPNGLRQITAFLMPGDACDLHIGLLAEMDHGIQTVTAAQVTTMANHQVDELLSAHPNIARAMYVAQLVDEGTLRSWIVSMGRRTSAERVAHLLLELSIRATNIGLAKGDSMDLPLSQGLLADALGITPVHTNRVLQVLRRSGGIELRRGVLTIKDAGVLTTIAGFDDNYLHRRMRPSSKET